ncbi:MAG: hypothetical protein NTY14_08560, partial [Candidatus Omnitrophica bacterium]|nr:hypothetical protein [Candidatus Omnitrophota bacterium]
MKSQANSTAVGKIFLRNVGILVFLGALFSLFAPPDALAVQVKRVQTGEVYFDSDDISQNVKVSAVDQTKTFILLYPYMDVSTTNNSQNTLYTADFESNSSIVVSRDGGTVACTVRYYVVEFVDGVNVQRGISSFAAGSYTNPDYTTKDITLTNSLTNYQNAFVIVQGRSNLTNYYSDQQTTVSGNLTDNNTLHLQRNASNETLRATNVVWQVVEFLHNNSTYPDFKTWSGATTIDIAETNHTAPLSPAITNLNQSLLFFTSRAGRGIVGNNTTMYGYENRYRTRGELTNTSTATFYRAYQNNVANTQVDIQWFVIEFYDQSSRVQKNTQAIASGTETITGSLAPAVDDTRSFPIISVSGPNQA